MVGLETAAALKNVYAIGLGICDGLSDLGGQPWNGLKAMVFVQALLEMSDVVELVGGRRETVLGLAGAGDLELTGASGRNRIYGQLIGRGASPNEALTMMHRRDATIEGHLAAAMARQLVVQRGGDSFIERLPLLSALASLIASGDSQDNAVRLLKEAAMLSGFRRLEEKASPSGDEQAVVA